MTTPPASAAPTPPTPSPAASMAAPVVTFEDLDNSVRNGKKKLYWSAFEVVLATAQPGGPPVETRYDAYQVNHNHLKKLHAGARGPHYVRVECKFCTTPRFTQSITVSTKKFEEHYMTLHALDALATAEAKKAQQQQQQRKASRLGNGAAGGEQDEDDEESVGEDDVEGRTRASKRGRRAEDSSATNGTAKRARRGALTRDDDDHVAAMQGAAAAVVALGNSAHANENAAHPPPQQATPGVTLSSSLVDSSIVLDPADSDTKRAKKSYWTAYEVVICERVPRSDISNADGVEGAVSATELGEIVTRETRQDAWRVNHNALRRLHLDPENDTTVRVECRFCDEPKFNQSITVSTRKFEQHFYYEHADETQRQELEDRLAAKAAEAAAHGDGVNGVSHDAALYMNKRRKSWKSLLMERDGPTFSTGATAKSPHGGAVRTVTIRQQRTMLLNWVLHECLPLSVIGSDHFQAFVATLDRKFEVPQSSVLHQELQQRLESVRGAVKKEIQEELAAGTSFVLTVNKFPVMSSGGETTYVSVTIHYITREWERKQEILACRALPPDASLNHEWLLVMSVLEEFGLPRKAIVSMTVRTVDAFQTAGIALHPLGLKDPRKASPAIVLCAAGALETVAQTFVDVLRRDASKHQPLVALLKQEGVSGDKYSWMDVHAALVEVRDCQTNGKESASSAASSNALEIAQAVCALLEPFARVAEDMSRTEYPTIPMIFQYFRHLKEILAQRAESNDTSSKAIASIVKEMQTKLNGAVRDVVGHKALVAYVLDPRFRLAHITTEDEARFRQAILDEIAAVTGDNNASTSDPHADGNSNTGDESGGGGTMRQPRSLFEELATSGKRTSIGSVAVVGSPAQAPSSSPNSSELDEYLGLEDEDFSVNVLQWWQAHEAQFPTLAQVARQFLALVGTSLPAEELFAPAGQQFALRRSMLEPETLEAIIVARAGPDPLADQHFPQPRARMLSPAADPKRRKPTSPQPSVAVAPQDLPVALATNDDNDPVAIIV